MKFFVNGRWRAPAAALISVADAGFAFGTGVFTTLRVHRGYPLFLDDHLERLKSHAARLGFEAPDSQAMSRVLLRGIEMNRLCEGVVKIIISPGPAALRVRDGQRSTLVVTFEEPRRNPGPVSLLLTPHEPSPWRALKTISYLDSVILLQRARRHRCYDAIAQDGGLLLEAGTANLFAVTARGLRTHPADGRILAGIARARLLARLGPAVREAPLGRSGLRRIEALFLTNCVRGVIPVASLRDERGREVWHGDPHHERIRDVRRVWHHIIRDAVMGLRSSG